MPEVTSSSGAVRQPRIAGTSASAIRRADRVAAAVAQAGDLDRHVGRVRGGDHVLDPHTGRPPSGLLSVTITGPDLATADAYATAAFAMGAQGPPWTARLDGYEAMSILESDTVTLDARLPRRRLIGGLGERRLCVHDALDRPEAASSVAHVRSERSCWGQD